MTVLTGIEAKNLLEDWMTDICAHADDVFEGTSARFILVVWPEGFESDTDAMAVFAQPQAHTVAVKALRTAAKALAAQPDPSQVGMEREARNEPIPSIPTKGEDHD